MKKSSSIVFTLEQLRNKPCADLNPELFQEQPEIAKKRTKVSKYRNKKTEVDGIMFDSAKEATRYKELLLLLKAGEIGHLELQVPFELNEGVKYIADFVYLDARTGDKVVEDVKSDHTKRLPVYRIKKKLMKSIYQIIIKEV